LLKANNKGNPSISLETVREKQILIVFGQGTSGLTELSKKENNFVIIKHTH
jgi:hypothetical protein